jgi:hypothetical protein
MIHNEDNQENDLVENLTDNPLDHKNATADKPSLKHVAGSILAAGFGVQSSKNRERDFKHGSLKIYLIGGIIFTIVFIATIVTVVNIVLG